MLRAPRTKRASVQDIYKSCIQGGDCPEDVKNKVEGTTWADTLLKAFSSIIYLGHLGIGTGRGSGGTYGYRPFGASNTRPIETPIAPSRPTVPSVDVIGPTDILPIAPEAPAIVPLSEGIPETGIIDTPGGGPGLDSTPITVTTSIDPTSEVVGAGEYPTVISENSEVAIIDVQTPPPPAKKILLDPSITNEQNPVITRASHTDSDINVFVNPLFDGYNIGDPEYIELEQINRMHEFEVESPPQESTPITTRMATRARDLYNRYVQQFPTRRADIVGLTLRPSVSQFENPAFDADVRNLFEEDVEAFSKNADSRVTPRLSATPSGTVRASRLVRKPGMTTRSGLDIGQRVHLYYDISPIPKEAIEMQPLGVASGESTLVDELAVSSIVNPFEEAIGDADLDLLDTLEEDFSRSQIILTAGGFEIDDIEVPTIPPGLTFDILHNSYTNTNTVNMDNTTAINIPSIVVPIGPSNSVDIFYYDYDLHPSLKRRKRKRNVF